MTAKLKSECNEKAKESISEEKLKDLLTEQLERVGTGGAFVWSLFFLCVTPNILNGFHVSSYTLLGHLPEDQWCAVANLQSTNWTVEQQRSIAQNNLNTDGCTIWQYDYPKLASMTYEEALHYTTQQTANGKPAEIPCKMEGEYAYWYQLFLVGRFGLGAASSALFYPAFAMIVENVCLRHRSWMSIAFSGSYPIGLIMLAVIAYLVPQWRYVQLALTMPALLLIFNCYLMNESPRWLITKKRYNQVYKILFKEECHYEIQKAPIEAITDKKAEAQPEAATTLWVKLREGPFKQFHELFGTWKVRRLIFTAYFMFCVTSLSYYVTALNAANMSVSRFIYVGITGIVDLPSYLLPVIMLRFTGRRTTTMSLFMLTGVALLMVLAVPSDNAVWIISFAMLGRFGITATYSIVTLYTAELFPTEIRNSALGTCSTWAHVGSISAPYVVDVLGLLGWYIPTTICGCCVLVAGLLTLTLPETSTHKLVDRVEEVPSESESSTEDNTTSTTVAKAKEIESSNKI